MYENNYLASRLSAGSAGDRDKDFLTLTASQRSVSYADFFFGAEKLAAGLREMGLAADDRVLVYTQKSATCLQLYVTCLIGGYIYVPINPDLPLTDLPYFLADAEPRLVVCGDDDLEAVDRLVESGLQARILTLNADETGSLVLLRESQSAGFSAVRRSGSDIAAILYTSGTTGRPKGAIHSHHALWSNAETLKHCWRFTSSDILIHALPIFHLHGLFTATNVVLASGASCRYLPRFDVDAVIDEMPGATVMMGVPPFYMRLLVHPGLARAAANIRLFISGSAPMLPQTHLEWRALTGHMIIERYGMTEASMIASNPYDRDRRPNSVGFPLPGVHVRIVDVQDGGETDVGGVGMIEIKGPNLFSGYWRKPEKTVEDMTADGFFVSGDLGHYDADGYLYVLCRAKDAIVTPGGIVLPKEVEELIDQNPAIAESAVIGVLTPEGSMAPVAVLVPNEESRIDIAAIELLLASRLEDYQRPLFYVEIAEMPRNAMGKVQKAALRDLYRGVLLEESEPNHAA